MIKTSTPRPSALSAPGAAGSAAVATPAKLSVADRLLINMRLIREWYHAQPTCGQTVGHNVMLEMVSNDVVSALELAIAGKTWSPPAK